jgi:hypothetical protein
MLKYISTFLPALPGSFPRKKADTEAIFSCWGVVKRGERGEKEGGKEKEKKRKREERGRKRDGKRPSHFNYDQMVTFSNIIGRILLSFVTFGTLVQLILDYYWSSTTIRLKCWMYTLAAA